MANCCDLKLVLYSSLLENVNVIKLASRLLTKDNDIIDSAEIKFEGFKDDVYCSYLEGVCHFYLDYEALNKFTKEYGIRWASVEENYVLDRFVINEDGDRFFGDVIIGGEDNLGITNDYYGSIDGLMDYLTDNGFLKPDYEDNVRKELYEVLSSANEHWINLNYLSDKVWLKNNIREENMDDYYFRVYNYDYHDENFWWNIGEEEREEEDYE